MIQRVITYRCTKCNSINIGKNGTDYKGKQKFHCLDCDAYGTLEPQSRSYPEFVKRVSDNSQSLFPDKNG